MPKAERTYDNSALVCPYCGHRHGDPDEFFRPGNEDTEVDCDDCGKRFAARRIVSVDYDTAELSSALGGGSGGEEEHCRSAE
jgi:DNA-directed RNA polymerase subunit RPC12/RpoP